MWITVCGRPAGGVLLRQQPSAMTMTTSSADRGGREVVIRVQVCA